MERKIRRAELNDATSVKRPIIPSIPRTQRPDLKEALRKKRQREILEERRNFVDNFPVDDYPQLKAEAERLRKIEAQQKAAEEEAKKKAAAEEEEARAQAWNKYET